MFSIDPTRIAAILADASWLDRIDLSSPVEAERRRAAMMLATEIVAGMDRPEMIIDPRQLALPIL